VIERKNDNERLIIGIFGDDYTRDNAFANNNLEREIESLGGEVQHVSIWSGYLRFHSSMKWRNSIKKGRYHELIYDLPKWVISEVDALRIEKYFKGRLRFLPEPDFNTMMEYARRYVDPRTDPVVIIALARIVNLLRHGVDGIVNVVGFQCTVYNIVSAMLKKLCADFGQRPYLTMLYDFHGGIHHRNRLEAFMYQVRQYKSQNVHNQITKTRP
jgi:predicted nucleotide-binding protein (sugar kinase/HSP70/actin superfamily)